MKQTHEFMKLAIETAAQSGNDIPVGAVIVRNGAILALAHNEKEAKNNPLLHAEMVAISLACEKLQTWRLDECEMFVTLEPCPMCAWGIIQSRIKKLTFGAHDALYGAFGSAIDLRAQANSKLIVQGGICEEECAKMISEYMNTVRGAQ